MESRSEYVDWYSSIEKPKWTPPSPVFGPVWGILYTLMIISVALLLINIETNKAIFPLILFAIQLALNFGWVWIFFGQHRIGSAFVEILFLWVAILLTMIEFWRLYPLSGALLLPYLLWVTLATALNYSIWKLNR